MWWILAASVVGVLVLAGGLAVYVAHQSVTTSVVVSPTPSAGPSTPSQGQQLSISGVKQNRTITCNDNIVTVSGDSNTVVISGHCTSLKVSGIKNSVTVDAVDTISASGFDNKITYRSGTPKITNSGLRNVVQQG